MAENNQLATEARLNAEKIEMALFDLSIFVINSTGKFNKYITESRKIIELFNFLTPLNKSDKYKLWDEFHGIISEKERTFNVSNNNCVNATFRKEEDVMAAIRAALAYVSGTLEDLGVAEEKLQAAAELMKPGLTNGCSGAESNLFANDGIMKKEELTECKYFWYQTQKQINERRKEIYQDNYNCILQEIKMISTLSNNDQTTDALKQIKLIKVKLLSIPILDDDKASILISLREYENKVADWFQKGKDIAAIKEKKWEQQQKSNEVKLKELEERISERDRLQKEYEQKKLEHEKVKLEISKIMSEKERKELEYKIRKFERERILQECEERQRERERWQLAVEEIKIDLADNVKNSDRNLKIETKVSGSISPLDGNGGCHHLFTDL